MKFRAIFERPCGSPGSAKAFLLHHDVGGKVHHAHRRIGPVHVLAALAAGAERVHPQVLRLDLDLDLVQLTGSDREKTRIAQRRVAGVFGDAEVERRRLTFGTIAAVQLGEPASCVVGSREGHGAMDRACPVDEAWEVSDAARGGPRGADAQGSRLPQVRRSVPPREALRGAGGPHLRRVLGRRLTMTGSTLLAPAWESRVCVFRISFAS